MLLAHSRIQNNASSSVVGNIATSPGTTINGFVPRDVTGSMDKNTGSARIARTDALTLHSALAALPVTEQRPPVLAGTVRPGVYTSTTGRFSFSGTLTLDAGGDPTAQFVFRADQLLADAISRIELNGGALAANVFFHCTSLRTNGITTLRGVFVASQDVLLSGTTDLHGHLIAINDSITLEGNLSAQSP